MCVPTPTLVVQESFSLRVLLWFGGACAPACQDLACIHSLCLNAQAREYSSMRLHLCLCVHRPTNYYSNTFLCLCVCQPRPSSSRKASVCVCCCGFRGACAPACQDLACIYSLFCNASAREGSAMRLHLQCVCVALLTTSRIFSLFERAREDSAMRLHHCLCVRRITNYDSNPSLCLSVCQPRPSWSRKASVCVCCCGFRGAG